MELRRYIEIVINRWPIALAGLLVTTLLTAVFVARQEPTYQSSGTYVVRPRTLDAVEGVRAIDTLIRGVEINSTYASIARSGQIFERAAATLSPDVGTSGLSSASNVVTGTNIIDISVTGPDPEAVYAMAVAVGQETIAYVDELQDVFELQLLDAPSEPNRPIGPKTGLTIATGLVLGAGLGVLLAVASEAFLAPAGPERRRRRSPTHLVDEADFRGRFQEELGMVLRAGRSFSVGILKVTLHGAGRSDGPTLLDLEAVARTRMPTLPSDDVVAYLGDGTFALLLVDATAEEAEDVLRIWRAAIGSELGGNGLASRTEVSIGVWAAEPTRWIPTGIEGPKE